MDIAAVCDRDTLLILANPQGPTCHLGRESCFGDMTHAYEFLAQLEMIIASRKEASPETSYTAKLFAKGTQRIAQKVGEEAVETALAATVHNRQETIDETSDLMYHLLVLLQKEGIGMREVIENLKKRHSDKTLLHPAH